MPDVDERARLPDRRETPMTRLRAALVAGAVVVAGLAAGAGASLMAMAQQQHGPGQMTEAQLAEHHRQLVAVLAAVFAETDFESVKAHITGAIQAHAGEIGGDTQAITAHVSDFLGHVAEAVDEDPQAAAERTANMLIEAHRPQQ
jgi:dsRNA-specific ribonuclease